MPAWQLTVSSARRAQIMDALRPGEQFVVCVDFKGMTRRNIDVKALLACFEILQKFYVERVQHLWFASPPAIFWCARQPLAARGEHARGCERMARW